MNDDQVTPTCMQLVHEYVKSLIEDAVLGAQHAGRTSVTGRDIALAIRMRSTSVCAADPATPRPR